ncbi:uncharacterized protein LOC143881525 isoform X2 [Tasmannia lanceolata]|uniref:uncharacterized protein LOC143881525 isoform X2 n=1 Tax=Tasmannia lanceolata TaxID=3420 RepID=UPI0040646ADA
MDVERSNGAKYECLLLDMDDTLYPLSSGLNLACRKNIEEYMLQHLQIEETEVPRMCLELYKEYGTTMAGLKIFTNADEAHVTQVLSRLGLEDCFDGVICFETLNPPIKLDKNDDKVDNSVPPSDDFSAEQDEHMFFAENDSETEVDEQNSVNNLRPRSEILCKPSVEAIEAAIQIANINPEKTLFFDDSVRNITAGKEAGLHTVIVGSSVLLPGADFALNSIHNIKEALPEIWEGEGDQLEPLLQSTTVETVVLA